MKNIKILILGIFLLLTGNFLNAQNIVNLNGTVTDANGSVVPNCEIAIEGDSFNLFIQTSIFTDFNGIYSLDIDLKNATIGVLSIYPKDSCIQSGGIKSRISSFGNVQDSISNDFVLCDVSTNCNISFNATLKKGSFYDFDLTVEGVAPYDYTLDFGDGSPLHSFYNTERTKDYHTYSHSGTFPTAITITDAKGCSSTQVMNIGITTDTTLLTFTGTSNNGLMNFIGNMNGSSIGYSGYFHIFHVNENRYSWGSVSNSNFQHGAGFGTSSPFYTCLSVDNNIISATKCDYFYYDINSDSLFVDRIDNYHTNTTSNNLYATIKGRGPFTCDWDFGDGNTLIQQNAPHYPSAYHSYTNSGNYNVCLTVTDSLGSMVTYCEPITVIADNNCNSSFTYQLNGSDLLLDAQMSGGIAPYNYVWNFGDTTQNPMLIMDTIGVYNVCVTITDSSGCSSTYCESINYFKNTVEGNVFIDLNADCQLNNGETNLSNTLIQIVNTNTSDTTFDITDSLGNYQLYLPDGNYEISAAPLSLYWQSCPTQTAVLTGTDTLNFSFGLQPLVNCSNLNVSLSSPVLVYGYDGTYIVDYCNVGTQNETNAYVEVMLDPFIIVNTTNLPYTQNGNIYTFQIGNVNVNDCGSFEIDFTLSTNANLGQIHCSEANIYPNQICLPNGMTWNGANIIVNAECIQGDSVRFTIENIGLGDMTQSRNYYVIEDQVLPYQGGYQLLTGEDTSWTIAANAGSIYFLQAEQEITHPFGNNLPTAVSFDCNNATANPNLINQFSLGDALNFQDVDCQQNAYSWDPNDKQGFPTGYGTDNYITKNDKIEYLIRFQNTGTYTAFNVRVEDEIDISTLDLSTLQLQGSSHNYELTIEDGNKLVFNFNNIMLPDSNTNEAESHGFIRFKISQKANNAIGTIIENNAAIYFDFNEPIITNTTFHTVGENFIQIVSTQTAKEKLANVKVFPNPFTEQATFEIETEKTYQNLTLNVFDVMGRMVKTVNSNGNNRIILNRNSLTSGVYFYQIQSDGLVLDSGKLMVK